MKNKLFKIIPFDVSKAKTPNNKDGYDVLTRDLDEVEILKTDRTSDNRPIVAIQKIKNKYDQLVSENVQTYLINGRYNDECETGLDLILRVPIGARVMTYKELVKWLCDGKDEYRQVKYNGAISSYLVYYQDSKDNEPVDSDNIQIRSNFGEWKDPIILIEE